MTFTQAGSSSALDRATLQLLSHCYFHKILAPCLQLYITCIILRSLYSFSTLIQLQRKRALIDSADIVPNKALGSVYRMYKPPGSHARYGCEGYVRDQMDEREAEVSPDTMMLGHWEWHWRFCTPCRLRRVSTLRRNRDTLPFSMVINVWKQPLRVSVCDLWGHVKCNHARRHETYGKRSWTLPFIFNVSEPSYPMGY